MHELIYLILGWLLGLLGPGITERIRRRYRQRDVVASIVNEMVELEYTLAAVSWKMRLKREDLTDDYLAWLQPIVDGYSGPEKSPGLADALRTIRKGTDTERRQAAKLLQDNTRGLSLKRYQVPFISAQAAEVSLCPLDFQRRVYRVMARLDLFNQEGTFLQGQFDRTFDVSIVGANRESVERDLKEGYANLARSSEGVAKAIGDIRSHYGTSVKQR